MRADRPKIPIIDPPADWQDDNLSRFMQLAYYNTLDVFQRFPELWAFLNKVEQALDFIAEQPQRTSSSSEATDDEVFDANMMHRMHDAYASALRLFLALQFPEASVMLRSALEYGSYAAFFRSQPEMRSVWKRRHEDEAALKAAKRITFGKGVDSIKRGNEELAIRLQNLYDCTIAEGAHPNPMGVELAEIHFADGRRVVNPFGDPYSPAFESCSASCVLIGIALLELSEHLSPELIKHHGLDSEIQSLKEGLPYLIESIRETIGDGIAWRAIKQAFQTGSKED